MPYVRRKPNGSWQGIYRDAAGRRHSRVFPTKSMARGWAADAEADVRRGVHRDPKAGRVTVGEWVPRWQAARQVERSTAASDVSRLGYVLDRWSGWPLEGIERIDVQGWVRQVESEHGAETARKCAHLLSSILESAVDSGRITVNPARRLTLPPVAPAPERFLTHAEVDTIIAAAPEHYRALVLFAAYTGCRWAEVAGLHVHRLDLLRRQVTVVETLRRDRTVKPYPKGQSRSRSLSPRVLPLTGRVVDALAALLAGRDRSGLVFLTERGRPLDYSRFRTRVWQPTVEASGVAAPLPTFHQLRHSYASWLVVAGVDLRTVQERLGHRSVTTTMRYAHLAPDADQRVLAALDAQVTPDTTKRPTPVKGVGR